MSILENTLRESLDSHPEDWALRILVAEKMLERNALQDAADLVNASPTPPQTEEQLYRLVELGGFGSIPLINDYIIAEPASGYAHTLLADLLHAKGDLTRAERHRNFALALNTPGASQLPEEYGDDEDPAEPAAEITTPIFAVPAPTSAPLTQSNTQASRGLVKKAAAPEASLKKEFGGEPRGAKSTAILVAAAVHFLIAVIAMIIVIMPPRRDDPEIVAAVIGPPAKKQEMQKKNVVKQTKETTAASAAAAPMAQLMRANAMAKIALPDVTRTSKGPLGIGDADFGGGGFGASGAGLGSGASFFGGTSTGKRFLFVLDHSGSMKPNQVNLRNAELEKALKGLKGVQYQVLLFAGGAYYAADGWSTTRKDRDNVVKGPKGSYTFLQKANLADFEFKGDESGLPTAEWLPADAGNFKMTMARIEKDPLFPGTDWGLALDIAHRMTPPPDVIFFMADGTGGNEPGPILKTNSKFGKPAINMVAMQTTQGIAQFSEIAKKTAGSYTIVDKEGKPIDGFDYQKNPEKYKGRL